MVKLDVSLQIKKKYSHNYEESDILRNKLYWEKRKWWIPDRVNGQSILIHSTIQWIFAEHIQCAKHCANWLVFSGGYNGQVLNTHGFFHIIISGKRF